MTSATNLQIFQPTLKKDYIMTKHKLSGLKDLFTSKLPETKNPNKRIKVPTRIPSWAAPKEKPLLNFVFTPATTSSPYNPPKTLTSVPPNSPSKQNSKLIRKSIDSKTKIPNRTQKNLPNYSPNTVNYCNRVGCSASLSHSQSLINKSPNSYIYQRQNKSKTDTAVFISHSTSLKRQCSNNSSQSTISCIPPNQKDQEYARMEKKIKDLQLQLDSQFILMDELETINKELCDQVDTQINKNKELVQENTLLKKLQTETNANNKNEKNMFRTNNSSFMRSNDTAINQNHLQFDNQTINDIYTLRKLLENLDKKLLNSNKNKNSKSQKKDKTCRQKHQTEINSTKGKNMNSYYNQSDIWKSYREEGDLQSDLMSPLYETFVTLVI
ncbi:hypothetical protein BB559_003518 [Furculomyces boomerangus]|uniref:Uncharacterized protein n=1 Tax=Furculomyces boomerangus TaxID=61424 RepID=A0A2T9YKT8_9FUNG|nr:hypothetical protein BB559_003518 [Furculomyces boomerangus]